MYVPDKKAYSPKFALKFSQETFRLVGHASTFLLVVCLSDLELHHRFSNI